MKKRNDEMTIYPFIVDLFLTDASLESRKEYLYPIDRIVFMSSLAKFILWLRYRWWLRKRYADIDLVVDFVNEFKIQKRFELRDDAKYLGYISYYYGNSKFVDDEVLALPQFRLISFLLRKANRLYNDMKSFKKLIKMSFKEFNSALELFLTDILWFENENRKSEESEESDNKIQ